MSHLVEILRHENTPSASNQAADLQPPTRLEPSKSNISVPGKVADIAAVDFTAQVDQNLPERHSDISEDPGSHGGSSPSAEGLERFSVAGPIKSPARNLQKSELWRARISPPKTETAKKNEDELQELIRQIYSIEFESPGETPESIVAVAAAPTPTSKHPEPNRTSADANTEPPAERRERAIVPKLPYEPVSDQTLQMLKSLLQHPDQLDNPFELGEVLFLSGHLQEAAISFKEAFSRKSPDQPDLAQDRAWILLQIGNCLRNDDLPTAAKTYRQLITEYPDSPWSDLAKAQYKLIEWYLKDKPRRLTAADIFPDSLIKDGISKSD
jgi:tetratricopeptide (TPR) repeat protein